MRGWEIFLVGFLVYSLDLGGAQLPEKLYFDGNQLAKDALVLEYRKSHPEATAKYLQARKLYLEILKEYPAWQNESGLVQKKLNELDERLRPLLLTQGISPGSIIQSPGSFQAKTVSEKTKPLTSHVPEPEALKKGMSIDEEIAALRALQARGETKVPAAFGHKSTKPSGADSPPTPILAKPSAPLSLSQTEKMARLQVEKERVEQALAEERQNNLKMEASYQARLRDALAARPKSLEPGEMAKQVTVNQTLRKDFEYLKVQSKRGESDLLDALEQLDKARKESEFLRKKFRELQAENQKLRRALSTPR
ncbi:MAG: hypothetical protein VYD34_05870 [Verrucomicrobiota bacterium]|nr:hypothetical protein [Verrucomicrobiota bacterium]